MNDYAPRGGNLTQTTYANGVAVTYSYDLLDRLVEKSYHETGKPDFTIRYTYNAESQLARLRYEEDGETVGSYAFEYDSLGRLIRSTAMDENGSVTQRTEHLYDAFNRLSGQSWTLGAQTYSERYAYSDGEKGDGSLTSMTAATGDSLSFGYDALKRLNRVTVKNGSSVILNTAYAYRDVSWNRGSAQVEFRNVRLGSDSGMLLEGKKYVYDDVGNLKEIRESTGDFNKLVEYAYDSQNQLTSEAYYKSGEAEAYITYNYTYDTAGNLLTVSQKKGNTTTLLQTYTYGDAQWHDLLTAVNGQAITYDASGNPLSYGGWSFGWQNGRQLKTASKTSDGKTETLEYAYDADGIRTSKTYTVETFTQVPDYTVTFQADGATVKTMTVEDGYTLKDSDYPAVPTKTGYTGEWVKYTSAIHSNVTVQAKYTAVSTDHTVTFKANGKTVKTMVVPDGYVLQDSDYPPIPPRVGYKGSWSKVTTAIRRDTVIYASYMPNGGGIVIPTQPTSPGEIMSGGEGEPVEADAPAEDETVAPQGTHVTGTQTVTHEYLTLNGKVARETIKTNNSLTAVLDFIYDESGKPFALKYSTNGTSFQTYYYVLNLQGDVVKLIHYIPGFEYESVATYEYDAWGNIVSSSGRLAEINPLRYRGYYYDSETGFYYLQSRYYDPANRRFISADSYQSTGQGFVGTNMFAYCNNNTPIYSDPTGHALKPLTTAICDGGSGLSSSELKIVNELIGRCKTAYQEATGGAEYYRIAKAGCTIDAGGFASFVANTNGNYLYAPASSAIVALANLAGKIPGCIASIIQVALPLIVSNTTYGGIPIIDNGSYDVYRIDAVTSITYSINRANGQLERVESHWASAIYFPEGSDLPMAIESFGYTIIGG